MIKPYTAVGLVPTVRDPQAQDDQRSTSTISRTS